MSRKKIRVGFDFDGVIAYNPFRIVRPVMAYIKKSILGVKKLEFWYPQHKWQQIFWTILHESSVLPAKGIGQFKKMVDEGQIEAHLVTARYSFLDNHLYRWLDRHKLRKYFKTVNLNRQNEQPHLFKEKLIGKYRLDFFIEDNLDIVTHLYKKTINNKQKTKVYWIYNLLDRNYPYRYKFPYLEKALEEFVNSSKIKAQRSKSSAKLKNISF